MHFFSVESVSQTRRWFLLLGIGLPIATTSAWGLIKLRNYFLGEPFSNHLFIYTDVPIIMLLSAGILILYQKLSTKPPDSLIPPADLITLKSHFKTQIIPVVEIAYIYRTEGLNYVRKKGGEVVLSDQSIKSHESVLSPRDFFRVNRQLLVNRQAITSYEVSADRKTILLLNPAWTEPVILDKNRLSQFKKWLKS